MIKVTFKNRVIALVIGLVVTSCGGGNNKQNETKNPTEPGGSTWKWVTDPNSITAREDKEVNLKQKKENDHWGYVNQNDEWVFEPKFTHTNEFSYGVAEVDLLGYKAYINSEGLMIAQPRFSATSQNLGGTMKITGIDGYSCKDGKIKEINGFSEGFAAVLSDTKWGYIGKHGTFVILPQFDKAGNFSNGKARVTYQGKDGYITLRNFDD